MYYAHWPEAKVVRRIRLDPSHLPTGSVANYRDGQLVPPPAEMVIARHDSVVRHGLLEVPTRYVVYYTFCLNDVGEEMTDLCHASLEDALVEAERGYQIKPDEWEVVGKVAVLPTMSQARRMTTPAECPK